MVSYEKSESPESKVTVRKAVKPIISISPQEVEVAVGQTVTFGGKVQDPLTGGIKGATVKLLVNNEEVGTATTDEGGNYQISHKFDKDGTYKVKVVFG